MSHVHIHRTGRRIAPHLSPFWRHLWQMCAVMVAGMVAAAAIFLTIIGMKWDEATVQHPLASLLVIATGMSVPMTGWMLYRKMGLKNSLEMAAAMLVPVIPFLFLVWFDLTKTAQCGPYCLISLAAMVGLMRYRRSEYSMEMAHR